MNACAVLVHCLLLLPLASAVRPFSLSHYGRKDVFGQGNASNLDGDSSGTANASSQQRKLLFYSLLWSIRALDYTPAILQAIDAGAKASKWINREERNREDFAKNWIDRVKDDKENGGWQFRYVAVVSQTWESGVGPYVDIPDHAAYGNFEEYIEQEVDFGPFGGSFTYRMYMMHVTKEGYFELRGDGGPMNWYIDGSYADEYPTQPYFRADGDGVYRAVFPAIYRFVERPAACGALPVSKMSDFDGLQDLLDPTTSMFSVLSAQAPDNVITHSVCGTTSCARHSASTMEYGSGACGPYDHSDQSYTCDPEYSAYCYEDMVVAEPGGKCGPRDTWPDHDYTGFLFAFRCPDGQCCSYDGYCGTTTNHCDVGLCDRFWGECGEQWTSAEGLPTAGPGEACGRGTAICGSGQCCSQYGWCGESDAHCGSGCQGGYGECN